MIYNKMFSIIHIKINLKNNYLFNYNDVYNK